jgi:uncharacterized protein
MTTEFAPGTPSWADLGTTDILAAGAFYGALFGWTVEDLGPESGNYGLIRMNGRQVAGIGPATDPDRGTSWAVYFATADADTTAAKVTTNGGTVVIPPMDVMDKGRMAVFQDPDGAFFSVWQAGTHLGAEIVGEAGSIVWAELMTNNVETATSFYGAVFGMTPRTLDLNEGMSYTLLHVDGSGIAGVTSLAQEGVGGPARWSVYFAVDDCDAIADQAVRLGGAELMRGPSPAGPLAMLTDPQGGQFNLLQPDPSFSM